jgi:hypothetical protein
LSTFNHSLTEGLLECVQVLTIMNKASVNIHIQVSLCAYIFISKE